MGIFYYAIFVLPIKCYLKVDLDCLYTYTVNSTATTKVFLGFFFKYNYSRGKEKLN